MLLLLACMWGFSMVVGSIGLALRDPNQLSNLLFPIMMLVAGTMYPIDLMPDWVRLPARCLPFGYAMQALVDSVVNHAAVSKLKDELLPLAAFAIALPLLGIGAFRAVERPVRMQGALELI
ncbi:MAG: ABC transporter permease [Nocardioidaceae bacterium]